MSYTLAQVDAFLVAIDRQESRRLSNLLSVIAVGSQGNVEARRKMLKELVC